MRKIELHLKMRILCPRNFYTAGSGIASAILDELVGLSKGQDSPLMSTNDSGAIPDISGFDIVAYLCDDFVNPAIDTILSIDGDTNPVSNEKNVKVITIDDDVSIVPEDENNYIQYGDLKVTRDMAKNLAKDERITAELANYIIKKMLDGHASDKLNLYNSYNVKSIQRNGPKANVGEIVREKLLMPHVFTVLNDGHYYLMIYFPLENKIVELNSLFLTFVKQRKNCRGKILEYLSGITGNNQARNADVAILNVPQQSDGSSCGFYMIHFLKLFSDTSMQFHDVRLCERSQYNYTAAHVLLDREKYFNHLDEEFIRMGKRPLDPISFDGRYEMKSIVSHSKSELGYEFVIEWEGDFECSTVSLFNIQGSRMLKEYFRLLKIPVPSEVLGHIRIVERDVFAAGGMTRLSYHHIPSLDEGMLIRNCEFELSDIPEKYAVERDESFVRLSNDENYSRLYAPKEFIRAGQTFTGSSTNNCLQVVCISNIQCTSIPKTVMYC